MKLRNIIKAAVVLGCAGVLAATFAACGNKEEDPPAAKKTHDPVTLEVTGQPGTYEPHNFVDGKCTMCDETTIFTQDSVAKDDIVTKACDRQGTVEEIKYTTAAYPDYEYADENGLVTKTAWVYLPYGYDAADTSTKIIFWYSCTAAALTRATGLQRAAMPIPASRAYISRAATALQMCSTP